MGKGYVYYFFKGINQYFKVKVNYKLIKKIYYFLEI